MTREEAIKILDPDTSTEALMEILYQHYYMSQAVIDALNMAVLALMLQPKWIPVTERLPDKPMKCLVYTKRGDCGGYDISYYNQGFYSQYANVTHWMPLPQLPKEE